MSEYRTWLFGEPMPDPGRVVRPVFWRLTTSGTGDEDGTEVIVNPFLVARLIPVVQTDRSHGTILRWHQGGGTRNIVVRETIEQILGEETTP